MNFIKKKKKKNELIVLVAFSMSTDCSSLFTSQRKFTDFFFASHFNAFILLIICIETMQSL